MPETVMHNKNTLNCPVRTSRDVCRPENAAGREDEAEAEAEELSVALLCLLMGWADVGFDTS